MFNQSRRNLARWFTLSMGSILVVFAGIVYYQKVADELEALDRSLYMNTRVMAGGVKFEVRQGQWQVNLESVPILGSNPPIPTTDIVYARWYDAESKLVQFFGATPPAQLTAVDEFQTIKTTDDLMGTKPSEVWLRQVTLPVEHAGSVIGYLQVATPMTPVQDSLRQSLLSLTLLVPVALGTIGLTGWILGGLAMLSAGAGALLAISFSTTPLLQRHLTPEEAAVFNKGGSISKSGLRMPELTRPVNILVMGMSVLTADVPNPPPETQNLSYQAQVNSFDGLSDVMLLVRFDPETETVTALSIPRDTQVEMEGYGTIKINAANVNGGPAASARLVSQLLEDVPIDRYMRVNVEGVQKLVDALGGVTVYVPKDMK